APQGRFVTTTYLPALALRGLWPARRGGPSMQNMMAKPDRDDLTFLAGLLEERRLAPVVDRCYPLGETAEAMRYVGAGHARGKVLVMPDGLDADAYAGH